MKVWATTLMLSILILTPCTAETNSTNKRSRHVENSDPSKWMSETGSAIKRFSRSLKFLEQLAGEVTANLHAQPHVPTAEQSDHIAFALDLINRQVGPLIELSENQASAADRAGDLPPRGTELTETVAYWNKVPRKLLFEESADQPNVALLRFRRHVINAVACAERTLECQRRAEVAIERYEAAWVVEHLDAALYLSWRGRQELREARKQWNVAISELGDWFERFEAQTSGQNITLEQRFAEWQKTARRNGLAEEYVTAMEKAGYLPHEIDRHKARLLGYDVRKTARVYSKFRSLLPALRKRFAVETASDHNFLEDKVWTRLCYIWASALEKFEQTGIAFNLIDIHGDAEDRFSGWRAIPTGAPANELSRWPVHKIEPHANSGPLVPGNYDVYLIINKPERKQPLPLAVCVGKNVAVKLGETTELSTHGVYVRPLHAPAVNSGVRLSVGDGQSLPHQWFSVEHGADWTRTVGSPYKDAKDRMLVAPGKYDVYLMEANRPPLLFARAVAVAQNNWTVIEVNSGIRLEVAGHLPKFGYKGSWGVVPAGANPDDMLQWSKSADHLTLPIGAYDVYWKHDFWHKPMLIAKNVRVEHGRLAPIRVNSGLKLNAAEWVPKFGYEGHWGVVWAGDSPDQILHWSKSPGQLLLPPGKYDVYWKQDFWHDALLMAGDVSVEQGKLAAIGFDSGIKLEVADGVSKFGYEGHWGVVRAGDRPDPMLHWSNSPGHLLLPPGKYDVYWKQSRFHKPRLVSSGVMVVRDVVLTVRVEHRS